MPGVVLGLDIGGANLKAARSDGKNCTVPFAVWKEPNRLAERLSELVGRMGPASGLAATMTAELCDCFAGKREGVAAILDALEAAAAGTPIRVWTTAGCWVSPAEARQRYLEASAANWLALAAWAGRWAPRGNALLIDIGSTTADMVPLSGGVPRPLGKTDLDRLIHGELVYTGVRRTPISALLPHIHVAGRSIRPAAEWFATTLDVYLMLGEIAEDATNRATADGRPAVRSAATARLARLLCADPEMLPAETIPDLCRRARTQQLSILCEAMEKVVAEMEQPPATVILAGEGEFLARGMLEEMDVRVVSLHDKLGAGLSRSACAYAAAVLASEESVFEKENLDE